EHVAWLQRHQQHCVMHSQHCSCVAFTTTCLQYCSCGVLAAALHCAHNTIAVAALCIVHSTALRLQQYCTCSIAHSITLCAQQHHTSPRAHQRSLGHLHDTSIYSVQLCLGTRSSSYTLVTWTLLVMLCHAKWHLLVAHYANAPDLFLRTPCSQVTCGIVHHSKPCVVHATALCLHHHTALAATPHCAMPCHSHALRAASTIRAAPPDTLRSLASVQNLQVIHQPRGHSALLYTITSGTSRACIMPIHLTAFCAHLGAISCNGHHRK
ncbi:hypothetical protein KI387_019025, partial [Taxus chinensis]